MKNDNLKEENSIEINLICVIVKYGMGSRIIRFSKQHGVKSATVLLGKGTIKHPLLELLELNEGRREIVLMATSKTISSKVMEKLNEKFHLDKPNTGISFTLPVMDVVHNYFNENVYSEKRERGENNPMFNLILTIVDRGNAEKVVDSANNVGSRGATIINARGSGIHETNKVFGMEIEPEKEAVLIISQSDMTEQIVSAIKEDLKIEKPGNGIVFVQHIEEAYGLH